MELCDWSKCTSWPLWCLLAPWAMWCHDLCPFDLSYLKNYSTESKEVGLFESCEYEIVYGYFRNQLGDHILMWHMMAKAKPQALDQIGRDRIELWKLILTLSLMQTVFALLGYAYPDTICLGKLKLTSCLTMAHALISIPISTLHAWWLHSVGQTCRYFLTWTSAVSNTQLICRWRPSFCNSCFGSVLPKPIMKALHPVLFLVCPLFICAKLLLWIWWLCISKFLKCLDNYTCCVPSCVPH